MRHGPTIADTVLELIRERGPMTLDGLVPPIVAAGRTRAKNPHNAVRTAIAYNAASIESPEGRWHSLADQLEGAVLTVPLHGHRPYCGFDDVTITSDSMMA